MARRYSPDELDALLRESQRDATRPTPVTLGSVGAQMAQAGIAALGAAMLVGGGLWLLGAPDAVLVQGPLLASLLVLGAGLVIRVVPADKAAQFRRIQAVQRMVVETEFRKRQAYAAIERLEGEQAARLAEMQRALDRMTQERDSAVLEKKRALEQLQSATARNFVRASNTDAETIADVHEILRYWFGSSEGKWFSRALANSFGWSDKRHKKAQQLLVDSGVLVINEKRPRVMAESLNVAIRAVNDHIARVESVYVPDVRVPSWDDGEE